MNDKIIRSVVPYDCPHCKTKLHICLGFNAPGLLWVVTADQMQANKARLKELLRGATFKTKEEEEQTLAYIDSEEFVLGEHDVDEVARDIVEAQKE